MISTTIVPKHLRGALDHERTDRGLLPHRLPEWARRRLPDAQFSMAESQPAGVRLAFRTAATAIEFDAVPTTRLYRGLPPRPDGVFDVVVDGALRHSLTSTGGDLVSIDMATGTTETTVGAAGTVGFSLPAGMTDVEIWLPHNQTVELVELRSDAPIENPSPSDASRWLHYGSSISQGSNAATPRRTWPALAAAALGLDLVNLGFAGSAMVDPFVARVIRDEPAELISLEVGVNIVNGDVMRARAFAPAVHGFLDTIRDGHPDVPVVVMSPIHCPIHENTPGPGAFDPAALTDGHVQFMATGEPGPGKLTLTVVRDELERTVAQRQDPNLMYLSGLDLYGEEDFAQYPLPDRLHPDATSHGLIGERVARRMQKYVRL